MAMAGMGDGMSPMAMIPSGCKIRMLWNWETIDACFLSEKWRIRSHGAFAGLCIGVILMVVLLEALRRASKLYDRRLISQHRRTLAMAMVHDNTHHSSEPISGTGSLIDKNYRPFDTNVPFRPNVWQQVVRAMLHMLQFALAYWIMLMAMYYNGFIIICIVIGAFIGAFAFQWERMADDCCLGVAVDSLFCEVTGRPLLLAPREMPQAAAASRPSINLTQYTKKAV
ncbi:hypothetical protein DL764_005656 [Monosporascus ibericus]|uniref:Copper transport protein n=1 Tax=Monosporascus ibericus TaxID=155417 RepID=A0A4Q4T8B7_9PEZI|nr:hypothetical protein DL764_005656 [Monosporascus ibericus]